MHCHYNRLCNNRLAIANRKGVKDMFNAMLNGATALGDTVAAFNAAEVMKSALESTQTQALDVITMAVPIIATVTAASVAAKIGFRWLKKLGNS